MSCIVPQCQIWAMARTTLQDLIKTFNILYICAHTVHIQPTGVSPSTWVITKCSFWKWMLCHLFFFLLFLCFSFWFSYLYFLIWFLYFLFLMRSKLYLTEWAYFFLPTNIPGDSSTYSVIVNLPLASSFFEWVCVCVCRHSEYTAACTSLWLCMYNVCHITVGSHLVVVTNVYIC